MENETIDMETQQANGKLTIIQKRVCFAYVMLFNCLIVTLVLFLIGICVNFNSTRINFSDLSWRSAIDQTAIDIQDSLDTSVDPCEDFYKFACGNYVPKVKRALTPFHEQILKYNRFIEDRLTLLSKPDDNLILQSAQNFSNICLRDDDYFDTESIQQFIRSKLDLPQWPAYFATILDKAYLSEKSADLELMFSLSVFFGVDLTLPTLEKMDSENPAAAAAVVTETFVFKIEPPVFNLSKELCMGNFSDATVNDHLQKNLIFQSEVIKEFGGEYVDDKKIVEEIIAFEFEFCNLLHLYQNNSASEEFNVGELETILENSNKKRRKISIRRTLDHILEKTNNTQLNVKDDDKIFVFNSTILKNIFTLISHTKDHILTNYMGYRLAMQLVNYSQKLSQLKKAMLNSNNDNATESGQNNIKNQDECEETRNNIFRPALTRYFHKTDEWFSIFGKDAADNIHEIFLNIKHELVSKVSNKSGNHNLSSRIGTIRTCQENFIWNETELEAYYRGLNQIRNDSLADFFTVPLWLNTKTFKLYGRVLPDEEYCNSFNDKYPAYFLPNLMKISIPQPLWLKPTYNNEWPLYLKYSGVADVTGHEMMHALFYLASEDGTGSYPDGSNEKIILNAEDKDDSLTLSPGLINSMKTYLNSSCIVNHYEQFVLDADKYTNTNDNGTIPKINGTRTFQENFCDIGGIQLAFLAYQSAIKKMDPKIPEIDLPGLSDDYTNEQLFFINYAQKWCAAYSKSARVKFLDSDHSPREFRVLGALRNNPDFARVWKCPVGSFMNSKDKCPVF